jgi:phytoene dehydrogenase-like protein
LEFTRLNTRTETSTLSLPTRISKEYTYDAIIVGSGPNGLAAAITLAQAGYSVLVFEAQETVGGGMRSAELTLPGFTHDICSAIHPLGVGSPFFRRLPLADYGLKWISPPLAVAHPFDDGSAATLEQSVTFTAKRLDQDAKTYRRLMDPFVANWDKLAHEFLGPLRLPRYPLTMARFGLYAIRSAWGLANSLFTGQQAHGLFAGLAAHAIMPLEKSPTAAIGLVLGILGHVTGWPLPQGGSQKIADALAAYLQALGGQIITGRRINSVDELPPAQVILLDVSPRQLLRVAGHHLPAGYRSQLETYRYGPGVFKVDWALAGPVPWLAQECLAAGTVHLGGTLPEIAAAERTVWQGQHPEKPFVLVAQQSLFDSSRAPAGKHTLWAYCHVPNGSTVDMTGAIENQIERFAPGFRDLILARNTLNPALLEAYNHNYIGGDINGGVQDWRQLFTRPTFRLVPYSTPNKRIYLCSASTPPGGGVHGMCGYFAAQAALRHLSRPKAM